MLQLVNADDDIWILTTLADTDTLPLDCVQASLTLDEVYECYEDVFLLQPPLKINSHHTPAKSTP